MGFFDKVKDVLTTSDAERARNARESADKAAGQADRTRQDADQHAEDAATTQREAGEASREAAAHEAGTTAAGSAATPRTHTVRSGDTLASIAEQHGADPQQLAELNRLDNPDLIYPGQVLRIPSS